MTSEIEKKFVLLPSVLTVLSTGHTHGRAHSLPKEDPTPGS